MSSIMHQLDENETSTVELLRQIIDQKNKQLNELRVFASLERESLEAQLQAIPDLRKMLETETLRRQELEKENHQHRENPSSNSPVPDIACVSCASKLSFSKNASSKTVLSIQQVWDGVIGFMLLKFHP